MRSMRFTTLLVALLVGVGLGSELPKLAYLEPCGHLMHLWDIGGIEDTAGLDVASYFAQEDSLGITLAHVRADSISTYNPYGIGIVGERHFRSFQGYTLDVLVHRSNSVRTEIENEEALEGYLWTTEGGAARTLDGREGILWQSGIDSADAILVSAGEKFTFRHYGSGTQPRFVMMVWDTVTTDTIVDITYTYRPNDTDVVNRAYSYTGKDFDAPGQWQTFVGRSHVQFGWKPTNISVYWRGQDSLAIDRIDVTDIFARILENVSADTAQAEFSDFFNSINTANHARFYPDDEPLASQVDGLKFYDDNANAVLPGHRVLTSVRWQVPVYLHVLQPPEHVPNWYPITGDHDSSSTSSVVAPMSIQLAYDELCLKLGEHAEYVRGVDSTDFWFLFQSDILGAENRHITSREMKAQLCLGLLYGIRGLGYFTYVDINQGLTADIDDTLQSPF